jgi:hypothetical protein
MLFSIFLLNFFFKCLKYIYNFIIIINISFRDEIMAGRLFSFLTMTFSSDIKKLAVKLNHTIVIMICTLSDIVLVGS